jgi:ubiquitin thioesterase OTU1
VKSGYPPRSLTVVPELPLASLGLQKGEQIIVNQKPSARGLGSHSQSPTKPKPASVTTGSESFTAAPVSKPSNSESGPDYVEVDGSVLVHRVKFYICSLLSGITKHRLYQMIILVYSPPLP